MLYRSFVGTFAHRILERENLASRSPIGSVTNLYYRAVTNFWRRQPKFCENLARAIPDFSRVGIYVVRDFRVRLLGFALAAARHTGSAVCRGLGLIVIVNSALAASDQATTEQHDAKVGSPSVVTFDLPAQPLATALETYGATSGFQVVYEGSLARGRRSAEVKGTFTPEIALRMLLNGTGLSPRYMADDGFVLVPDPAVKSAQQNLTVNTAPLSVVTQYYGRIQAVLRQTFCADRRARSGGYRVAVGLWIGSGGAVTRSALLDTTGDPDLDKTLDRAIGEMNVGEPPPAGFAQPVVMVITPDVTRDCLAAKP
jgi:TonB C terminal